MRIGEDFLPAVVKSRAGRAFVGGCVRAFWRGIGALALERGICSLRVCIPFQRGATGGDVMGGMLLRSRGTMVGGCVWAFWRLVSGAAGRRGIWRRPQARGFAGVP